MKDLVLYQLIAAALFITACSADHSNSSSNNLQSSNQQMSALLDSLARVADPMESYHLNAQRASVYAKALEQPNLEPSQLLQLRFQYSNELLSAGRNEDAIVELEALVQQMKAWNMGISEQTKMVFEFLALAYLRMGEQQNCVENNNPASCILPISVVGQYRLTQSTERAIRFYSQILQAFPNDKQSQWLLNLAYMNLGGYPDQVPSQWRLAPETFAREFSWPQTARARGVNHLGISGGVCLEDFNGDGRLDLLVSSYGPYDQIKLFLQHERGPFHDATEQAGLLGLYGGLNLVHADYNNDGWPDVLVLRGGWLGKGGRLPNSLLRNNGDGSFTDVTVEAGLLEFLPTQVAAWADFDGDGFLDLFIGNESAQGVEAPSSLYRNLGNGRFEKMPASSGLQLNAFVKGAVWGDVNNDGLPDLYVSILGGANKLFLNRGGQNPPTWRFEETAQAAGVAEPLWSFPAFFFDFNHDGFDDLFVGSYDALRQDQVGAELLSEYASLPFSENKPRLYLNNGDGSFQDITSRAGLDKVLFAMGANFGDLDNDGWLDFYLGTGAPDLRSLMPNRLFRNVNGQRFAEWTMNGFGHIQKGHGIAFGDIFNNGQQDMYAVMGGAFEGDLSYNVLFENPGNDNQWVTIKLQGTSSNHAAIGARIYLQVRQPDGSVRHLYHTVSTGGSFGASSLQQEIGLGKATEILELTIRWPGDYNQPEQFTGVRPGARWLLEQGAGVAKLFN
jgi:tetratricopeptide (TPR) repeat protein